MANGRPVGAADKIIAVTAASRVKDGADRSQLAQQSVYCVMPLGNGLGRFADCSVSWCAICWIREWLMMKEECAP